MVPMNPRSGSAISALLGAAGSAWQPVATHSAPSARAVRKPRSLRLEGRSYLAQRNLWLDRGLRQRLIGNLGNDTGVGQRIASSSRLRSRNDGWRRFRHHPRLVLLGTVGDDAGQADEQDHRRKADEPDLQALHRLRAVSG